jgi:hypothetical protein
MSNKEEINDLTRSIQKECHDLAWQLKDQAPDTFAKCESQDMTNIFLFKKLAEFEYRLKQLETRLQDNN